jgi:hypothetical protein
MEPDYPDDDRRDLIKSCDSIYPANPEKPPTPDQEGFKRTASGFTYAEWKMNMLHDAGLGKRSGMLRCSRAYPLARIPDFIATNCCVVQLFAPC